jgi:hypothetical protein
MKKRKSKRIELTDTAIKYWTNQAEKNGNKFKPFVEHLLETKKIESK